MNKNILKTYTGDLLGILTFFLFSFFPIFTILTLSKLSPFYSAGFSNLVSAILFIIVMSFQKKWYELKKIHVWKYILLATIINSTFVTLLLFIGLKYTSAGNASIVMLMEIFFSYLFLGLLKKEKIIKKNAFGAVLMIIGAVIIFLPKTSKINIGDLFILISAMIVGFGNYFQKKARKEVSSATIMAVRALLGSFIIFLLAVIFSTPPTFQNFSQSLFFVFFNGFIFIGFTNLVWIEAIHRIEITKAVSFMTLMPVFTMIFSYLILKEIPSLNQIFGAIAIIFGALLILSKNK
jgi:drug/metabolite transporter (DMT)-like permease